MNIPQEIMDGALGTLELLEETAYFTEISWSRDIEIRVFIHITSENYGSQIQNAKKMLPTLQNNEEKLLEEGVNYLLRSKTIDDSYDWNEMFLHNAAETSIEFNTDGSGHFVYLVMMAGSIIIEFDNDANFKAAEAIGG